MLETLTYVALVLTLVFTGYYALIFLRDSASAMETATHELELLPEVMAARYVVVFLITAGIMIWGSPALITYFFAVCTFLGLYDGWVYYSRGLPHMKHTFSGLMSLLALFVSSLALLTSGSTA